MISQGFKRDNIDTTLFTTGEKDNLIIVWVYVDDNVFESKNDKLCEEFASIIQKEFEIAWWKSWIFFSLQIKQEFDIMLWT